MAKYPQLRKHFVNVNPYHVTCFETLFTQPPSKQKQNAINLEQINNKYKITIMHIMKDMHQLIIIINNIYVRVKSGSQS